MARVSRREFLQYGAGASATLAFMAANGIRLSASPLGLPIGSQAWPHRARIGTNGYAGLASLLKDMKAIGIESIELISPSGEFSTLTDGKQVRKILDDNGMKSPSAHFRGVRTNLPTLIQWAHDIGMTHMSMASMGGQTVNGVTTLETVKKTCDEYNKLGAIAKKEGLQMMTHNEGFENSRLDDGRLTYPLLLEYLDPTAVLPRVAGWLAPGGVFSVVLQRPGGDARISATGFASLQTLTGLMRLVDPDDLRGLATRVGLVELASRDVPLARGKSFWAATFGRAAG